MITCIYASTSGNTEATIEQIATILNNNKFQTQLFRVEKTTPEILRKNDFIIFGTSTWGHGELNPLWKKMLTEMETTNFTGKKAAFVGLGDFRYEPVYFCKGIDILKDTFVKSGGEQVHMTLKINGDPYAQFDKLIKVWTEGLIVELKKNGNK